MNKENVISIINKQIQHQKSCLNLIASENCVSSDVAGIRASSLCDRYILSDFPNTQMLRGLQEQLSADLRSLFGAQRVNVSPVSGLNCMELILNALVGPSENVYILNPMDGGHSATYKICSLCHVNVHFLDINLNANSFDHEAIEQRFRKYPPKLVYLDYALILYYTPIAYLCDLVKKHKGVLVYDGSHVLGLIAGKSFPNPLNDGADILCGSTHKTFFGTQKAIILSNNDNLMDKIDKVAADYISHTHTGELLGLLLSAVEMKTNGLFYASQVVKNAGKLAEELSQRGLNVVKLPNKQIETHQIWIDVGDNVSVAYNCLEKCHINVNAMRIPLLKREGLRLGVAYVTRMGMKENEMSIIAELITDCLRQEKDSQAILEKVIAFCEDYSARSVLESPVIAEEFFKMHSLDSLSLSYLQYAEKYCEECLSSISGFCGMIVRGGVGRGTADIFSDIDFTAIFDCESINNVIKDNHLSLGMHKYGGVCFSGRYISLSDFENCQWSPKMKHAYQFVQLINCTKNVEDIIKTHTVIDDKEQLRRIIGNIIEVGEICKIYDSYKGFDMFSEIYKQLARKEYLSANLEIDRGVKYLKNIIFDLNKIHYPEEKSYYVSFFSNLPVQPENFDESVRCLLEMDRSQQTICQRLSAFRNLAKTVISFAEKKVSIPDNMYDFYMNNI